MTYQPTPEERKELADIQAYLAGHARNGTLDRLPEGGVNALLNKASPAVRAHMKANQAIVENFRQSGGRSMPFEPKRTVEDLNVPDHTRQIMARADQEEITHGLLSRMGTSTPGADNSPPSLREHIEAAFDAPTQPE